ncbi:CoA ester lyase [Alphaproteobacteria bacterium]|nr:CoA ester lyase [Alphaproteobacteria bacterium]
MPSSSLQRKNGQPARLRRSQLAVPGSNDAMMAKAAASNADGVFCDLEDSVSPNEKAKARLAVCEALNGLDWGRKVKSVRVNDVGTQWCFDDIITIVEKAGENLDTIILPKPICASDVQFADTLLSQLEQKLGLKHKIGLEVIIEEVQAMQNIAEIAMSCDRLEALILGMGDYAASQGMRIKNIGEAEGYPGDIFHYPRYQIIIAARSAGLDAVDGPVADFKNMAAFVNGCHEASALGMVGKWAIHPSQIQPALDAFSPSAEDVEFARAVIGAYQDALNKGLGSVSHEGVMVDAASVRLFQNTIDRANQMGM